MYRDLAQYDRARFISDVALSLNNLSLCLAGVGNSAGALSAIREAVDVRRQLAQENPARFDLDLAVSLKDLSDSLSNANDGDDALAAIREAVTIYRRLPVRFAPDLARSLDNLSLRLAEANDAAGALAASHEAVDTYRRLAQGDPPRFDPYLATNSIICRFALPKLVTPRAPWQRPARWWTPTAG